jgi:hypothetical protein
MKTEIEATCEKKCLEVTQGTSSDLLRINKKLLLTKERKIATADKLRKFQVKNLHAHYEFELKDLQVQYENAFEAAKENLIAGYKREAAKAIELENERMEKEKELKEKEERERKAREEFEKNKVSCRSGSVENGCNSDTDEEQVIVQRATRTSGVQEFVELKGTDAGGLKVQGQHDATKEKEKAANERKRKLEQVTNQKLEFVRTIPKHAMITDFAEIVGNMEKRNRDYVRTQPRNLGVNFQLVEDTFTFHMRINGRNIYTGDMVVVFSSLSRESFCGVLTCIEEDEIIVRCGNGATFTFTAEQVKAGRVTVTRDDEGIAAAEAIKEAAKLLAPKLSNL